MRLPKKISPCPIIESIFEIRFNSAVPPDAIFGVVYNSFKDEFSENPINLPILQLPADIRNKDPNLLYNPHYRLSDGTFLLQIGPRSFSLINKGEYVGWDAFFPKIKSCFSKINSLNIIENINRLGLRYINFFDKTDIYEKINLKLLLNEKPLQSKKVVIKTTLDAGELQSTLQISNDSKLEDKTTKMFGSIIDIDVYLDDHVQNSKTLVGPNENMIEKAHFEEKKLFYSLLKKDFLIQFSPEY